MLKKPFFSVIVASYNYAQYIDVTLISLAKQTFKDFEVIIVDDGSTDNSIEIIKRFCRNYSNFRLVQHYDKQNHGLAETIKLGLLNTQGKYIGFCESDDFWTEDHLQKKYDLIQTHKNENPIIIINDVESFGIVRLAQNRNAASTNRLSDIVQHGNKINISTLFSKNVIVTFSCCMVRRKELLSCNFNSPVTGWTDWWLWAQILAKQPYIHTINEKLTYWRSHTGSQIQTIDARQNLNIFSNQLKISINTVNTTAISDKRIPFFSVIIASYNYEKYISQTINSILNQTFTNFEIIIVDDGSTDGSMKIINEYAAKYDFIHVFQHKDKKNHGLPDTIELAISHSNGKYLAFCESDDYWHKNHLHEKMKMIIKYNFKPNVIINDFTPIGTNIENMLELQKNRNHRLPKIINSINPKIFDNENLICTFSICMVKREMFNNIDFNTPFKPNLDWWLWNQIIKKDNRLYFIHKKLTYWRSHNDSQMEKNKILIKDNPQMLENFLTLLNKQEFK